MKLRRYLIEGVYADRAKTVRDAIKEKYGLTSRDVSVSLSRGSALNIRIKTVKGLPYMNKLKDIGSGVENVHRDAGGNILRGGNFFVFTEVDWKFRDQLVKKIEAEISKKVTDEFMYGEGGGNSIEVFGNYTVYKDRSAKTDEFRVSHPKQGHAGPVLRSIIEAAGRVLSLMLEYEDTKNLKKLG